MAKEMKITFKLSEKDYLDFNRYALCRIKNQHSNPKLELAKKAVVWFILAFAFASILQLPSNDPLNFDLNSALIASTPFIIFIVALIYSQNKLFKQAVPYENGIVLGEKTIEFKDEGIYEKSQFCHSFYQWELVHSLEENNGALYIFVDKILALIIPIQANTDDSESDIESIKTFIKSKISGQ